MRFFSSIIIPTTPTNLNELYLMTLASQITANANFVDRFKGTPVFTAETDLQQSFQHHLFLLYKQRFLGVNISTQEPEDDLDSLFVESSTEVDTGSDSLETNHHHIYIRFTKLNTFVTISNENQEPCLSFSLGQLQLKSALQRKTNFAFKMIIQTILQFLLERNVTQYTVYLRGPLMTMRKYYSKLKKN
jgi:ribosomal protein S11